jgi:hypothetical protein
LRDNAPECKGIHPGSWLQVRLKAYRQPGCPTASQATPIFCGDSTVVSIPNGRQDNRVALPLTCSPSCSGSQ